MPLTASADDRPMTADRDRDQRLLERIRAGDVAAFEALYRSIAPSRCVFTRRLLQSEAAAEDVVHDLFLAIWQQRATLDVRGSISTYLHTAARNRALNQIKHERIVAQWENAPHPGSDELQPTIEEGLVEADLSVAVQEAVARLPERPRLVFTMSRHQRMTHKQIADSLGVSIKTVETHMGRALRLMRDSLAAYLR